MYTKLTKAYKKRGLGFKQWLYFFLVFVLLGTQVQAQTTICSGLTFNYTNVTAGKPAGTKFTWTVSNVNPAGTVTGWSNNAVLSTSISQVLTNSTTNVAFVTYDITNDADFTTTQYIVTVNPTPDLTGTTTGSVCSGSTFAYTPTTLPVGTTVAWSRATVVGITPLTGNGTGNIIETLTNTTSSALTATYNLVLTSLDGCINSSRNVTAVVNPKPTMTSATSPTGICSGSSFTYTATSDQDPSVNYTWTRNFVAGISNLAGTGTGNVNEILTNTTAGNLSVVYNYVLTNTVTGCVTNQNVTVGVNAKPVLTSSTSNSSICSGTPYTYTALSSIPSATITWTRASVANITPNAGSGTTSISETLTNSSNVSAATVSYAFALNNAGCTNAQSFNVTVNPTPILSSSLTPAASCTGAAFTYTPTSAISGLTYTWSRAVVAGISNSASSGSFAINETLINTTTAAIPVSYVYTLTNPVTLCTNTQTVVVIVNPIPSIAAQVQTTCSAIAFSLSPAGAPVGTTYTWSAPTSTPSGVISGTSGTNQSSITQTLSNTTTTSATATYSITPKLGSCVGSNFSLVVTVIPAPIISNQTATAVCSGSTFTVAPTGVPVGTTYTWATAPTITPTGGLSGGSAQSAQASISQTLSSTNNLLNTAVYTVTPTANGCAGSNFTVTVPAKSYFEYCTTSSKYLFWKQFLFQSFYCEWYNIHMGYAGSIPCRFCKWSEFSSNAS